MEPGLLLQQAWGPASDKGVRTMDHTIGLKLKTQMGLGTPCRTPLNRKKINDKIKNFTVEIDKKFIYILKAKIEIKSN